VSRNDRIVTNVLQQRDTWHGLRWKGDLMTPSAQFLAALSGLLLLGACAARAGDPVPAGATPGDAPLPEPLRAGASARHARRALPALAYREFALARVGPNGRQVRVAVGDFRAPMVVLGEPGQDGAPRVLLAGGNVRLAIPVPPGMLREVALEEVVLAPSQRGAEAAALAGDTPSVRLGPGAPVTRLGRAPSAHLAGAGASPGRTWIRYATSELEAVGLVEERRIGHVYALAPERVAEPTDGELVTPIYLLDRPGGRPLATVLRGAGPRVRVARLARPRQGHQLVRIRLSGGAVVTGWVPTDEIEVAPIDVREPARDRVAAAGHWLSLAELPGRDPGCVELARSTRLFERPGGPVAGLVTRSDRFVLLRQRADGWIEVGVGHPFGLSRLWVSGRRMRPAPCDNRLADPGLTARARRAAQRTASVPPAG
jgi:hypothetical protein